MAPMGPGKPDRTDPRLPLWAAMLVGVVSVGSAVAAGQFVAAFVGVPASPFLAVGNAAINLTPGWLKEFATTNFGTSDKTVLLSAMAVVLLGFGLLAGALSRRTAAIGTVFAIVLGLLAMAAVLARTDVGQLAVLAPFVSLIAGVVV